MGEPLIGRPEAEVVAGRYVLHRQLAAGGMAEVWLARDLHSEQPVVLKRIHPHLASQAEYVQMFCDEARTTVVLDHPNVVQLTGFGTHRDRPFLVIKYLVGRDVGQIVERLRARGERMPIACALQIIIGAARGLDYAHRKTDSQGVPQRIVHRDVSPQNLMLTFGGLTKLLDFGIASAESRMTQTASGVVKGKFAYMSPEQVDGDPLDGRSDQFSLAIVLHELLTGRPLFERKSDALTFLAVGRSEVPSPTVSSELNGVVLKGLSRNPAERFRACGELADVLSEILGALDESSPPLNVGPWLQRLFEDPELGVVAPAVVPTRNDRVKFRTRTKSGVKPVRDLAAG